MQSTMICATDPMTAPKEITRQTTLRACRATHVGFYSVMLACLMCICTGSSITSGYKLMAPMRPVTSLKNGMSMAITAAGKHDAVREQICNLSAMQGDIVLQSTLYKRAWGGPYHPFPALSVQRQGSKHCSKPAECCLKAPHDLKGEKWKCEQVGKKALSTNTSKAVLTGTLQPFAFCQSHCCSMRQTAGGSTTSCTHSCC